MPYLPSLSIGSSGRTFHGIDFVPDCSVPHLRPKGLALIVWGEVCVCGGGGGRGGAIAGTEWRQYRRSKKMSGIPQNEAFPSRKHRYLCGASTMRFVFHSFVWKKSHLSSPSPLTTPPPPRPSLLWQYRHSLFGVHCKCQRFPVLILDYYISDFLLHSDIFFYPDPLIKNQRFNI